MQSNSAPEFPFVFTDLHESLIDDPEFGPEWRLHLTDETQLKSLPCKIFSKELKEFYRRALKKSRFGLAVDNIGTPAILKNKKQMKEFKKDTLQNMGYCK